MSPPKSEQDEKQQRRLKREVLLYLKEHGPTNYTHLFVHFDPHMTAHVAPVLQDLRHWQYIEMGEQDLIHITKAGWQLLDDVNYWV